MEAKNFRIGNWIRTHKEEQIVDVLCDSINTYSHECMTYDNVGFIEITNDWLIDFGFMKDNNGNYWIDLQTHYLELMPSNGYWYPVYAQVPEMSHEDDQCVSLNRIQYVHELQNLFFALTGNELESS
jgi:hypothetical protein